MPALAPAAVYVHTPFCPSKCGYCDFNSYAMSGDIMERTTAATIEEIRRSPWRGVPAKTIFFGGGTPTFLPQDQLVRMLEAVAEVHPPIEGAEITSEANPGTVDMAKFGAMRRAGFNRVSLGAQSFAAGDLVRLGRVHEADHVAAAVGAARRAGFDNLSLDLMFALPGQSLRAWQRNLDIAFGLKPDHLSLYCLTIEANTRFHRLWQRGMLHLPDDEAQVAMYDAAVDRAEAEGLGQYEISNFGRPGRESRHNLCYWRCEDYASYGPGAVGCMPLEGRRIRYTNTKHPERYSGIVESGADLWCDHEALTPEAERTERIMMGLRLNEGLNSDGLDLDEKAVGRLVERGWMERIGPRLKLTRAGQHFCSEAAVELM